MPPPHLPPCQDISQAGNPRPDTRSAQRHVRIRPATWYAGVAKAKTRGLPIGRVITVLLDKWIAGEIEL
jgi:hypothetical protein